MFGLTPSFLQSIGKHPGMNNLGGTTKKPKTPDYIGAAEATAEGNLKLAEQNTLANRVNQNTPLGSQQYTKNPDGTWTLNTTYSDEQQKLLDQQTNTSLGLGGAIDAALGRVNQNTGIDISKLPDMPTTADTAGRDAMTASLLERMQPSLDRNRQQTESQLLIQGHNRGGEAWNAKQDDLNRTENDAKMTAYQAGGDEQSRMFGLGTQARQNALGEQQTVSNDALNTLSSLRSGAQVQSPQFANTPNQQGVAGADLLGATSALGNYQQGMYNAQQGGSNAMTSGLFGLGNAAIGAWSDRRLKRNIVRIGNHIIGVGLYVFEYLWSPEKHIGVMADEVLKVIPEAVELQPNGFYKVDYSKLEAV